MKKLISLLSLLLLATLLTNGEVRSQETVTIDALKKGSEELLFFEGLRCSLSGDVFQYVQLQFLLACSNVTSTGWPTRSVLSGVVGGTRRSRLVDPRVADLSGLLTSKATRQKITSVKYDAYENRLEEMWINRGSHIHISIVCITAPKSQ